MPLVSRSAKAESARPDVESIQEDSRTHSLARTSNHPLPGGSRSWPWVTFKRSRLQEIRTLGSARAKVEWLSYSTIPAGR